MPAHPIYEAIIDCTLQGGGHYIPCKAGKQYPIPLSLAHQARSYGMKLISGDAGVPISNVVDPTRGQPDSNEERRELIKMAMRDMVVENDPHTFAGGTGRPNATTLSKKVGFQVFASEVKDIWAEVKQELAKETQ